MSEAHPPHLFHFKVEKNINNIFWTPDYFWGTFWTPDYFWGTFVEK